MPKKNQTDKNQPLAIVGIGCLFPKANNPKQYWTNIREGIDAIVDIPPSHWRVDDYFDVDQSVPDMTYARRGGFIDLQDFNPLLYGISPNNIEATDTTQLLGMLVAKQALLDAGYSTGKEAGDGREFNRDRTSVILGVTGTLELVIPLGARLGHPIWRKALQDAGIDPETTEDIVQRIADGYVSWQENSFPGLLGNVVAGRIANRFDLGGTNCVVDAACASSLSALHLAAMELQTGRVDMAITGGMDTFNDIFMYMCFSKTLALSPTGNSRPFAKDGDGTILGEGLGAVILKRLADAERDSDNIYAILKGVGASSDGRGNAIYAPSSAGQIKALRNAYKEADVSPRSITLIEAHGTGTSVGDAVEATALSEVYAKDNPDEIWCAVGSVKSMIGHTKAAAGVAGLIKTTLALKHKVLPPSIKVDEPLEILDPGTAPIYLNTVKRPWITNLSSPRRAALSSSGFGGSNFHCVLEEAEPDKHEIDWDGNVIIMALSAASADQLVNVLPDRETLASWDEFRFYCYDSCQTFESTLASRLIAVFDKESGRDKLLQTIRKRLLEEADFWSTPNMFYQNGKNAMKSAFIFPGQGSQYVGMGRDLACQFPQFFAELENANRVFTETSDALLTDFIYPIPVFNEAAAKQQEADLRQTQHAQPAIGAMSLGCLNVLKHFSIEVDATLGHSYGELTALTAAGSIEPEQLHYLSRQRGELMNSGTGDRGGMIAVISSLDTVESFMHQHDIDLVVANHNSPEQVVLSGASEQINAFAKCAKQEKIRVVRLPVAAAFHSRYVADAAKPFAKVLADIQFLKPKIPVLSNTNTEPYPDDIDSAKRLLSEQLVKPVRFVEQIERLYQNGVTHFIEVGPGKTLSALVAAILSEQPHQSISIDASCGKKLGQYDLAILLAKLAVAGFTVDLRRWDSACAKLERPQHDAKPAMTVAVGGANIMQTRPQRSLVKTKHPLPSELDKSAMSQNDTKNPSPGITSNKGQSSLLQATQESILALQKMQEQTARLHQQYLEGQETAQQTIQSLLVQQQALLQSEPEPLPSLPILTQHVVQPTETTVAETSVNIPDSTQAKLSTTAVKEIEETRHQRQDIDNLLLKVVSEKTGYPLEMLSLDMSLDTDLGIDSIKRVEILSTIQEQLPWLPAIKPEELGTFQFLQHIVEFLAEARSDNERLTITESTEPSEVKDNLAFQQTLVGIVAEKTGYPESMLSLEMNLDSDLGIDSIKRVEILSAMQERIPSLPAVSPEQLSQFKTLQSIIEIFTSTAEANETESVTNDSVQKHQFDIILFDVIADKTGYPVDMLNPDMHLDGDLGIDSIKRVEILSELQEQLPGLPFVAADNLASLQTLQQIIDFMLQQSGQQSVVNASNIMSDPGQEKQHTAEIETSLSLHILKLTGLDVINRAAIQLRNAAEICVFSDNAEQAECLINEIICHGLSVRHIEIEDEAKDNTSGLIIHADSFANNNRIVDIFELLQRFSQILQRNNGLLVSLSSMGGDFGIRRMPLNLVSQAACHGMVKTADKEWSSVQCRCLDVDRFDAEKIIDEMLQTGPIETALYNDKWNQLTTSHIPLPKASELNYLNQDDVIVISGGARGVTAEVAVTLAETYQCNLILLGRSPEPTEEPNWLRNIDDEAGIKRALLEHAHHTYTPAELGKACSQVLANREIGQTLSRIRNTGAVVNYCSVDITDFDNLEQALNLCRIELGNITGIIHAAGILADCLIEDKTRNQFEQVYKTKVEGLQNLLHVTSKDELKLMVMFSSITARLGRKGQSDYAAANEVLNKIAQYENQQRQGCKVLSINWGPWNGGMVTSSLRKLFAEEGVGVIGLKQGAEYLINEIETDGPVELMILADHVNSSVADAGQPATRVSDFSQQEMRVAFERELSVNSYSFLSSHVMNGQAVLPVAVIIEWFAHGALHLNPGMQFHGFNRFRVLKGVTLTASDTVQLRILVGDLLFEQGMAYVPVELRSKQHLNASAVMVLTNDYAVDAAPRLEPASGYYQFKQGEYYQNGQLFHGQQLQGIKEVLHCDDRGIVAEVESAPIPAAWMKQPIRSNWLTDPLILDSAFQLMILWSFENQGIGSLPTAIQSYRQFQRSFPKDGARIIVGVKEHTSNHATATIEFLDSENQLIAIMETYECVRDGSLRNAFKENDLSLKI